MYVYLSIYPSIHPSIHLSIHLSILYTYVNSVCFWLNAFLRPTHCQRGAQQLKMYAATSAGELDIRVNSTEMAMERERTSSSGVSSRIAGLPVVDCRLYRCLALLFLMACPPLDPLLAQQQEAFAEQNACLTRSMRTVKAPFCSPARSLYIYI